MSKTILFSFILILLSFNILCFNKQHKYFSLCNYHENNGNLSFELCLNDTLNARDLSLTTTEIHFLVEEHSEYKINSANNLRKLDGITLSKPYFIRDFKGQALSLDLNKLFAEKNKVKIDLTSENSIREAIEINPYFKEIYNYHFYNFSSLRYESIAENGSMLIISYDDFIPYLEDFISWKEQKGISVDVVPVSEIGNTYDEISSYISNSYTQDPNLTFIQLVGDYNQVKSSDWGGTSIIFARDGEYSFIVGDDGYPDIFVGRFSAENPEDLITQLERSINYEKNITEGDWLSSASGACSNFPPIPGDNDEHNWDHLDIIREKLLNYTYDTVDRVYANEGANTGDLISSINNGISLLNYCGEGYDTYWVNPEFHNSDVELLTNAFELPFIHCVSCYTGNFAETTCLAEKLVRAKDNNNSPTGAIGIYASSPPQAVDYPMRSQDHFVDLLIDNSMLTLGGLCFNGSCDMIDEYGEYGTYTTMSWNLFGDCSLLLRTTQPEAISFDSPTTISTDTQTILVNINEPDICVSISKDNELISSVFSNESGEVFLNIEEALEVGDYINLTLTGFNKITEQIQIPVINENSPFLSVDDLIITSGDNNVMTSGEEGLLEFYISNISQSIANNVYIELDSQSNLINIDEPIVYLDSIEPSQIITCSFAFNLNITDLDYSVIPFQITLNADNFQNNYYFSEILFAPKFKIHEMSKINNSAMMNPGKLIDMQVIIENIGSCTTNNFDLNISSNNGLIDIINISIPQTELEPDSNQVITFQLEIDEEIEALTLFEISSTATGEGALPVDKTFRWQITPYQKVNESFESEELVFFPWIISSWNKSEDSFEGNYSIKTDDLDDNDNAELEFEFDCLEAGQLSYYFKTSTEQNHDLLEFYLDNNLIYQSSGISDWEFFEINISEGKHTAKWAYVKDSQNSSGDDCVWLDLINIPKSLLSNIALEINPEIIIIDPNNPNDLEHSIELSSIDGKLVNYLVIPTYERNERDLSQVEFTANTDTFTPGDNKTILLSLDNSANQENIESILLHFPSTIAPISVSNFVSSGSNVLTYEVFDDHITWTNNDSEVTEAMGIVNFLFSTDIETLTLDYEIFGDGSGDNPHYISGTWSFSSDANPSNWFDLEYSGTLYSDETDNITFTLNENYNPEIAENLTLKILYNTFQQKEIDIRFEELPVEDNVFPNKSNLLLGCYPNPFVSKSNQRNPNISIECFIKEAESIIDLTFYNLKGQIVNKIQKTGVDEGIQKIYWNGKDQNGINLPSGIYFCRLNVNSDLIETRKIIILK